MLIILAISRLNMLLRDRGELGCGDSGSLSKNLMALRAAGDFLRGGLVAIFLFDGCAGKVDGQWVRNCVNLGDTSI